MKPTDRELLVRALALLDKIVAARKGCGIFLGYDIVGDIDGLLETIDEASSKRPLLDDYHGGTNESLDSANL